MIFSQDIIEHSSIYICNLITSRLQNCFEAVNDEEKVFFFYIHLGMISKQLPAFYITCRKELNSIREFDINKRTVTTLFLQLAIGNIRFGHNMTSGACFFLSLLATYWPKLMFATIECRFQSLWLHSLINN